MINAGVAPGPEVGRILGALEEQWLSSNFTFSREKLLDKVETLKPQ